MVAKYRHVPLAGIVTSDDYPGSIVAAIVAKELGLYAPEPKALLCCQHKYYSRIAQKEAVPEAVPRFTLVDPKNVVSPFPLPFPCFVKPVKSYFSCFANQVQTHAELVSAACNIPHPAFLEPLNQLLKHYSPFELSANYLIAEELLDGVQATIEGYAFDGTYGFLGIVDSIMYPGTISFQRFEYPSSLPMQVQKRAEEMAERCMRHIGFDNGIFNIEFFYNPHKDSIHIIEINPRMASQFADLYEKVDGTSTYDVAISIATGKKPAVQKRQGLYPLAASCVLREFTNMTVTKVPKHQVIEELNLLYPGTIVEVLVREGRRLSEELQDGKSYRYALVQLGAENSLDLQTKLIDCQKRLDFQFDLSKMLNCNYSAPRFKREDREESEENAKNFLL
jgi:hypothetical protein